MDMLGWLDTSFRDIRYALRQFLRNPAFAALAILSLAIGIGINTAIFSVLNAALFKTLPVRSPNELVVLTDPNASVLLDGLQSGVRSFLSYAEFVQLRDHTTTMSGICASGLPLQRWPVRILGGAQEDVRGRVVSEDYFSVFGVQAAIGRFFTLEDATYFGKDPYAVISYDYWERRFGGNRAVLGTPIRFYRTTVVVIGVAAPNFRGETAGQNPDLWLPMMMQPLVMPGTDWLHQNSLMWLHVFGRLKTGVTITEAQAETNVLFRGIIEAKYPATMPEAARTEALNQRIVVKPAHTGVFSGRDAFSEQWTILLALAGLVLLVACVNVANLLLARATARSREMAIRLSMGAARGRLVRQLLTESLLLASLSGIAGIFVAAGASRSLPNLLSQANNFFEFAPDMDSTVLGFAACTTLATGIIFGLVPAFRASHTDINERLRETCRSAAGFGHRATLAKALAATQIALSLLLVMGAGLFLRTLWNLQSISLGYPAGNLLLVKVDSLSAGYRGARRQSLYHALANRIRALPGVHNVTYSRLGLFDGVEGPVAIAVDGFMPQGVDDSGSAVDYVGPGYFSALGIPVPMGREIGPQDTGSSTRVCVINEAFAKRFFAGRNPMGKHITSSTGVLSDESAGEGSRRSLEVVGVAKDARDHSLLGGIPPRFYVPVDQDGVWPVMIFEIRTTGAPTPILKTLRKAILEVDGELPIQHLGTLGQLIEAQNARPNLIARLCTVFGIVALLLASTGIYGVLSYSVARRTNEIGIRMALGANKSRVIAMILQEMAFMIAIGVIAGMAVTAVSERLIATQLFGLSPMDPLTLGVTVGILGAVALIAAYIPAARAARVDPLRALRHE